MDPIGRRSAPLLVVLTLLWIAAFLSPAEAGRKIVGDKHGEPPARHAEVVFRHAFPDVPPRVSAIERARQRTGRPGAPDTVRLLALRVEFQPDADPLSTGDGTFDYSPWDGVTFDGPPHDRRYFELHMTALESYYESVSYDRLQIEWAVAPADSRAAYVLPHQMGYYHDYSSEQVWYVDQVERFTRDAFAAADTTDSIDFSEFDGFVLFHAGSDWQTDINIDSPYDLPSAHISLGEPILVNDGAVEVWDAAIMPETSNQDGLVVVLNGTLAHEVGHILGLPDLYNVRNFYPAIGYWGIMDSGGRIGMSTELGYAYGLIPTPPCAWSKEYMGWLDPVVLMDDAESLEVRASVLRGEGERLYKIPATSDEYFLIENRLDDLGSNGLVVLELEGSVILGPVRPDCTEDICPVNHEYDYLVPGPGLLIYHIDDTRVIPGLMPWDTVNVDADRRGVAVEEADGIMDLGDISSFYWTGSRYDPFFCRDEPGTLCVHNNTFSWDTFPSTETNLGGATYISVTNISNPGTVMTMDVHFDRWKDGWPIDLGEAIGPVSPRVADLDGDGDGEVLAGTVSGNLYAWHHDGEPLIAETGARADGFFARAAGGLEVAPAVADLDGDGEAEVIAASRGGSLYVWTIHDVDADGAADLFGPAFPISIDGPASAAPLAADLDSAPGLEVAAASRGGALVIVDGAGSHLGASPHAFGHLSLDQVTLAAGDLTGNGLDELVLSTTNEGLVVAVDGQGVSIEGWPQYVPGWHDQTFGMVLGDLDRAADGALEVVAASSGGEVRVWDGAGELLPGWPRNLGGEIAGRPGLGDLDGDGYLEVVAPVSFSRVGALRWNGAPLEDWPAGLSPGDSLRANRTSPLIGDIDADGDVDVVVAGPGGNIYAWDGRSGELHPGWPLSSDPSPGAPWIGDIEGDGETDLLVAGAPGRVALMRLPYDVDPGAGIEPGAIVWSTEAGTADGAGCYPDSLLPGGPSAAPELMDPERTYCFPNPARRRDLTVRVHLEEPAPIVVEFLDVTGQVVDRMEREGVHAVNDIVWGTDGVASGLYLVRVEVGRSPVAQLGGCGHRSGEVKIMKVAVVR